MSGAGEENEDTARIGNFAKKELFDILVKLLGCENDMDFLLQLNENCLERLIAAVRVRVERTA